MKKEVVKAVQKLKSSNLIQSQKVDLSAAEIVRELDKYIIGQKSAKRAVAIALRNRNRRLALTGDIRDEISPKNIMMVGCTGVGKTEIARRLAKIVDAPFIKVEATKFSEIGYVGKEVDSIIRDLVTQSFNEEKQKYKNKIKDQIQSKIEDRILDILLPMPRKETKNSAEPKDKDASDNSIKKTREKLRNKLLKGQLDNKEIEINASHPSMRNNLPNMEIMPIGIDNFEKIDVLMEQMLKQFNQPSKGKVQKTTVKEAKKILQLQLEEEMLNLDKITRIAIDRTENMGIVFIDEIDKIANNRESGQGGEVSREGVQRDILPLVEGCTVNTRYGTVKTDHILFISSGAFHISSPNDLIPELQGRFPIRVELDELTSEDLKKIMTKPKNALIKQYQALLKTDNTRLEFEQKAINEIARVAMETNKTHYNIGARRLSTIIERILEDILFDAPGKENKFIITEKYVKEKLKVLKERKDISKYIL